MLKTCAAYNCKERGLKGSRISFFAFPTDPKLRNQWVLAMRRKNFEPTIHSKLCAKHFLESDIIKRFGQTKLRNGTIPSIFDFPENSRMKPPELSKSRTRLEKEIQKESTSKEKKLDLRSTSTENCSDHRSIDTRDCSKKFLIRKKARRKSYIEDIKSSNSESTAGEKLQHESATNGDDNDDKAEYIVLQSDLGDYIEEDEIKIDMPKSPPQYSILAGPRPKKPKQSHLEVHSNVDESNCFNSVTKTNNKRKLKDDESLEIFAKYMVSLMKDMPKRKCEEAQLKIISVILELKMYEESNSEDTSQLTTNESFSKN